MRPKAPPFELVHRAPSSGDPHTRRQPVRTTSGKLETEPVALGPAGAGLPEAKPAEAEPAESKALPSEPPASGTREVGSSTNPLWRWAGRAGVFVALFLGACMPPTPAQKATDAARELNMGARWGRMNEASAWAAPKARAEFAKNRVNWHGHLRIVETELTGLDMKDATHATVHVDVSWMFDDDPTLRVTRLKQEWSDAEGKWVMLSEERTSGDIGLFGEEVKRAEKRKDMHFPSRVIH